LPEFYFTGHHTIATPEIWEGDFLESTCKCNTFKQNVYMSNYYHLSPEERAVIMIQLSKGHSIRSIGRFLSRSASTISRELNRNKEKSGDKYCASNAGYQYSRRRKASVK